MSKSRWRRWWGQTDPRTGEAEPRAACCWLKPSGGGKHGPESALYHHPHRHRHRQREGRWWRRWTDPPSCSGIHTCAIRSLLCSRPSVVDATDARSGARAGAGGRQPTTRSDRAKRGDAIGRRCSSAGARRRVRGNGRSTSRSCSCNGGDGGSSSNSSSRNGGGERASRAGRASTPAELQ